MSLYIDLSQMLANPTRTGIQRVTGEMCRYLPPNAAIPVRLHAGRLVSLPPPLIQAIGAYFKEDGDSGAEKIRRLGEPTAARAVTLGASDIVLVPELFFDAPRVAFFREMPEKEFQHYRFIVYDLIPITHPEYFFPYMHLEAVFGYFRIIRQASQCAFISRDVQDVYYRRLKRTNDVQGTVLPLGADSMGARVTHPRLGRPLEFCVLGTIESRKNPQLILEAFDPLLRQLEGLSLNFVGKFGWLEPEFARSLESIAAAPGSGVRLHSGCTDREIQSYIERSRATIFVSSAEGYGLPPVESLWLGTPVIASTLIPSLKAIGTRGVHYVETLSVINLRRAILAFIEDDYANQKTAETTLLDLPAWRSFTEEALRWCGQGVGQSPIGTGARA